MTLLESVRRYLEKGDSKGHVRLSEKKVPESAETGDDKVHLSGSDKRDQPSDFSGAVLKNSW